jgi:hypothetical protein
MAGLTVSNQAVGNCTSFSFQDVKPLPEPNPGDGIMGFAGSKESGFHPPANSWFWNLCENKAISECKLGLLFGEHSIANVSVGMNINSSCRYERQRPKNISRASLP